MNCLCEGKESEINQSRVYEVNYGTNDRIKPEQMHDPPSRIVVNNGYPITRMNFGWY